MEDSVSRTSQNMERSDSMTPETKHNPQVGNDFVGIFRSLRLGNDGDHPSIQNSDIVNAADGESSTNITSRTLTTQTTSDQTQSFLFGSIGQTTGGLQDFTSANPFGYENIGGSRVSGSEGKDIIWENSSRYFNDQGSSSNVRSANPFSFNNPFFAAMEQTRYSTNGIRFNELNCGGVNISNNLGVGSSTRQGMMDYFHQSQPDTGHHYEIRNPDIRTSFYCNDPIRHAPMNPFRGIQIDGLRSSLGYHTMNNSWNQNATQSNYSQGSNLQIGSQAGEREFTWFQGTLGNHNPWAWRPPTLFSQFQGSFLALMTDTHVHFLFEMLLNECKDEQLDSLVQELLLGDTKSFLSAAYCREGSTSINKLIKRIKKTIHAYTLTRLLSTALDSLMTDDTANTVIKQCLDQFGSRPNQVLYETVILHHMELAIDEVGCRSLNDCISTISGKQKITLLGKIVDNAVLLSNDRYGNYVVQHAMILGHDFVTFKVLHRLRGHFMQLSQEKGGSHVVEKCVNSSRFGTDLVVREILETPSAPFKLARHQYGNYVIQAALRSLKRQQNETLYVILVRALKPHFPQLQLNEGGKQVINLIMSDSRIRRYQRRPEY